MTWQESILFFSVGLLIMTHQVNKTIERKNNWPDIFERKTLKCLDILNQELISKDEWESLNDAQKKEQWSLFYKKQSCLDSDFSRCIARVTGGYVLKSEDGYGPSCLYDVKWFYHDGVTSVAYWPDGYHY